MISFIKTCKILMIKPSNSDFWRKTWSNQTWDSTIPARQSSVIHSVALTSNEASTCRLSYSPPAISDWMITLRWGSPLACRRPIGWKDYVAGTRPQKSTGIPLKAIIIAFFDAAVRWGSGGTLSLLRDGGFSWLDRMWEGSREVRLGLE